MENQESIYEEKQGNLLTGILGALLGALIGTALWVLVGVWGYIAGIVAWLENHRSQAEARNASRLLSPHGWLRRLWNPGRIASFSKD